MKSILKQPVKFELGKLYPLEDIRRETGFFKTKANISSDVGLFHLYAHRVKGECWLGGPFDGPQSNFFLFLGVPKSAEELRAMVAQIGPTKDGSAEDLFKLPNSGVDLSQFDDLIELIADLDFSDWDFGSD